VARKIEEALGRRKISPVVTPPRRNLPKRRVKRIRIIPMDVLSNGAVLIRYWIM